MPLRPLRRQQRVEFDDGPLDAERREADRDEGGVPTPHVRVQQRRRGGHHAQVVAAQQVRGAGRELSGGEAGIGCHLSIGGSQVGRVTGMPTAFITGPAGGLGTAIADALAPTHTLFLGGRPSNRLDALAERLGATTWPLDLQDADAIGSVVEPIDELDVLIHNAGVAFPGRVAESEVDEWRITMEVNVIGAVALTLALLPALRRPAATSCSSTPAQGSPPHPVWRPTPQASSPFAASRTRCATTNPPLRVTSIHPGRIATVMQEGAGRLRGPRLRPGSVSEPRDGRESRGRRGQRPARRPHPRGRHPPQRVTSARAVMLSVT